MSTTSLGDLFVNIIANNDDYNKDIDASKTKTDSLTTSVKKLIGAGVLIALAKKVADVGAAAISAASDAEETQNKFDVVFSSMSDAANDMATELADAYGLSIQGAKDMLAGTGDLLTGLGFTQESAFDLSEQVLTLGADLASFTNYSGGAEGASEALTKALLGERESLKGLGISINETDLKAEVLRQTNAGLTFETDKQAKAQATLTLVMNQSKNAMGDFERSQESYANQMKIAKARTNDLQVELGRALLPTATKGIGIFSTLTGKLASYIKNLNDVKVAEEAQASGNATREQRILILEDERQGLVKLEAGFRNVADAELEEYGVITASTQAELTKIENQKSGIDGKITGIKRVLTEEKILFEAERNAEETRLLKVQKEKDAADARAQQYIDQNTAVQEILTANKSEIDIIDEKIEEISKLALADSTYYDDQQAAIKLLQDEKKAILDEEVAAEQQANLDIVTANQERIDKIAALEKEKKDKEDADRAERIAADRAEQEGYVSLGIAASNSLFDIYDNYNQSRVDSGEKTAQEIYDIELAQFYANKALSAIQAGINIALAITEPKVLANPFMIAAVAAAGAIQEVAILTAPAPTAPAFAYGGVATAATTAVVGEAGGEVMLGMGAKGAPLIDELASRIASKSGGGQSIIINQNNMLNLSNEENLSLAAEALYDKLESVKQRRGA